ncbi:MAG: hypothetical protein O2931_04925 [Planctomycetota bacterium]|nr:hypothetical protein [Planctomycetota bacterium]
MDETRPPVILIGRGITTLGALRCLSRQGLRVHTACDDQLVPRSRYFRPAITSTGQRWQCELGPQGYEILAAMPFDRAVLFPCADDIAMWVAELPPELQHRFIASNGSAAALRVLQDKRRFSELCVSLKIPHPRCFLVSTPEDLDAVPFEEMPRVFFKPSNSIPFLKKFGVKGLWVHNREEAQRIFRQVCASDQEVLVQEYVAGSAQDHYFIDGFVDRHGDVRAVFARRRERIYPPDFGNSSYCYNVPVDSISPAWDSLRKILQHVGYRGIFSGEFKHDATDGQFRILEINTRAWVYVEFAASCGIDVCRLAYEDACGANVPDLKITRPGAGCVDLYHDLLSVRSMPTGERPNPLKLGYQWFRAHKSAFCFSDPYPAFRWTTQVLRNRLLRIWNGR